mmetsp:Transcript_17541/g.59952  ORF Transcript_17541/g.59952 Transcript_17541/m.59952 type:complete len:331 (+) Transcript_17541:989-1981(+)
MVPGVPVLGPDHHHLRGLRRLHPQGVVRGNVHHIRAGRGLGHLRHLLRQRRHPHHLARRRRHPLPRAHGHRDGVRQGVLPAAGADAAGAQLRGLRLQHQQGRQRGGHDGGLAGDAEGGHTPLPARGAGAQGAHVRELRPRVHQVARHAPAARHMLQGGGCDPGGRRRAGDVLPEARQRARGECRPGHDVRHAGRRVVLRGDRAADRVPADGVGAGAVPVRAALADEGRLRRRAQGVPGAEGGVPRHREAEGGGQEAPGLGDAAAEEPAHSRRLDAQAPLRRRGVGVVDALRARAAGRPRAEGVGGRRGRGHGAAAERGGSRVCGDPGAEY